jgi:hypothetical protein
MKTSAARILQESAKAFAATFYVTGGFLSNVLKLQGQPSVSNFK